jgi:23S rRNA (cytosine1962-C5)-methyltransferase
MAKVFLHPKKHGRISAGHPWVFANEIAKTEGDFKNGDIAEVYDAHQHFLGKGFINSNSKIVVRILSRDKSAEINADFIRLKINAANAFRNSIGYKKNYRVVFGEADGLPALVVDKFEDVIVIQTLCLGIDVWKKEIVKILSAIFSTEKIFERNDVAVRELEGMQQQSGFLLKKFDTKLIMEQDGIKFWIDVLNGQKTGFFHDQRRNRLAMQTFVKNADVLDACCYTGSFGLYAAKFGAKSVEQLDISTYAINQCRENVALNNFSNFNFTTANVFDELKNKITQGKKYDVVMLDPPAFAKSRKSLDSALKGYKEINLRAMQLVKPGGYLISSSCSHYIYAHEFQSMLADAAGDAKRLIRQVLFQSQSPDHPIILNIPENHYLKCAMLQVL